MKKITLLLITGFLTLTVWGQTIDASYLNPQLGGSTYKHTRFGSETEYVASFMHNISSATYGDGDDFTILTYGNRDINFRTGTGNVIFFPSSGGNVGIGTTSPDAKLDVTASGANGLVLNQDLSSSGNSARLFFKGSSETFTILNVQGKLQFRSDATVGSSSGTARMAIDGDGNVGIGTTDPQKALHIMSSDVPKIYIESTSTTDPTINFRVSDTQYGVTGWDIGDNVMKFKYGGSMTGSEGINIDVNNSVGIGTTSIPSGYKLAVDGNAIFEEVKIKVSEDWADFVFEDGYNLMPLDELETYIEENNHLPEIPTTREVEENGISVGGMNAKLLQKIEELTLYTLQQQEVIEALAKQIEVQNERIKELENK